MDHQSNSSRYGAKPMLLCVARAFWIPVVLISLVWAAGLGFSQEEVQKSASAPTQLESQYRESVRPVLEKYCFRCHGPEKKKSGVRVDILDASLEDKQLFLLKHVLKQLKEGSMPPKKARQPSAEERKVVLEWVSQVLRAGERKVRARNGSVRRLTVEQYHNTLRDLLGVEDLLAKALPADGVSKEGFRNNQDTLLLMPQMMETYFEIAEKALDLCLVDETKKPRIQCFRVELGKGLNKKPTADKLVLNGPNLLPKANFLVRQVVPDKPFPFEPLAMRTKFRFIEGYAGNGTVRAWKNFEGIYHNVFAALNGNFTGGLNYGRSHVFVPEGLLLRPRSPETQNGKPPQQGPSPSFSMPLRELPSSGIFQLTVEAARYDDGFQPSSHLWKAGVGFELDVNGGKGASLEIPAAGVYQLDVVLEGNPRDDVMTADIGHRTFSKRLKGKFAKGSESAGAVAVKSLPGIVIDDPAADKAGDWTDSVHGKPYLGKGYIHDGNTSKGVKFVTFNVKLPRTGNYQVNLAYTYGNNRSPAVPVDIHHADGVESAKVNQMKQPPIGGLFIPLGSFRFEKEKPAIVVISNKDTQGHVIVDGLQFIEEEAAKKPAAKKPAAKKDGKGQKAKNTARLKKIADNIKKLNNKIAAAKKNQPVTGKALSVEEHPKPADSPIHIRGEVRNLGPKVPRGFLSVLAAKKPAVISDKESGRLQLANWIASGENSLTSRVAVNRIWHHLFGAGLVRTVDNFGKMGEKPSHPELLDYLARRFIEQGWSRKKIIREILVSNTYRQSTDYEPKVLELDPENRLLSHASRRRLDAESLRDSILHCSGELDLTAGGPTIAAKGKGPIAKKIEYSYDFKSMRRSVYVPVFRNTLLDIFEVFDFPDPNISSGKRATTTRPTQALFLLNSPFLIARSAESAKLLLNLEGLDDTRRIEQAYLRILSRPPDKIEISLAADYLKSHPYRQVKKEPEIAAGRLEAWASLCHALLSCNDFRYLK